MQSDQLYAKGDLTATVTMSSISSNALLMVFFLSYGNWAQRILEKLPVSLFLIWHAPYVAAKYSWFSHFLSCL